MIGKNADYDDWKATEPTSDVEPIHYCEECGEPLYEGDRCYNVCGYYFCEDCMDNFLITL